MNTILSRNAVPGFYNLDVDFDGENTRSVQIPNTWQSCMTDAEIRRAREKWCVEDPLISVKFTVKFRCTIQAFGAREEDVSVYETALRVLPDARGDWYDLAPTESDKVAAADKLEYRVTLFVRLGDVEIKILDGRMKNEKDKQKLIKLGPNTQATVYAPSEGLILFVHWIGNSPGFVTASLNCSTCPV